MYVLFGQFEAKLLPLCCGGVFTKCVSTPAWQLQLAIKSISQFLLPCLFIFILYYSRLFYLYCISSDVSVLSVYTLCKWGLHILNIQKNAGFVVSNTNLFIIGIQESEIKKTGTNITLLTDHQTFRLTFIHRLSSVAIVS